MVVIYKNKPFLILEMLNLQIKHFPVLKRYLNCGLSLGYMYFKIIIRLPDLQLTESKSEIELCRFSSPNDHFV